MKYTRTFQAWILLVVLLAFSVSDAEAQRQKFYLFNVDVSKFPEVSANIYAIGNFGDEIYDFDVSEFDITDNNISIDNAEISVECDPPGEPDPFRAVLALDRSLSMNSGLSQDDGTRIDLVRSGAAVFLSSIDTSGNYKIALTSFDDEVHLERDFTKNLLLLKSDVNIINPNSTFGTDFTPVFLNHPYGAVSMLRSEPLNYRRMCILITDGEPTRDPETFTIIDECKSNGIEVFVVTVDVPMNRDLQYIAEQTGGVAFGNMRTEEDAWAIFKLISQRSQGTRNCRITWRVPVDCNYPTKHEAEVVFKRFNLKHIFEYDVSGLVSAPEIDVPDEEFICQGGSVQLTAVGTEGEVSWFPTDGLDDPNSRTPIASPGQGTGYTVVLRDTNGCEVSDNIFVHVIEPEVTAPDDEEICIGGSVQLNSSGSAGTYEWRPRNGLSDHTIENPVASPTETTTYYVTVKAGDCFAEDSVTVVVNGRDLFVDIPEERVSLCQGETYRLQANAHASASRFEWLPDEGLSDNGIADPVVNTLESRTYVLTVWDEHGCSVVDSIAVEILDQPFISVDRPDPVCDGEEIMLQTRGLTGDYEWSPRTYLDDHQSATPTVNAPPGDHRYTVTVTTGGGCSSTASVTVRVNSLPTVDAGADQQFCPGESVTLQASADDGDYLWTPDTGLDNATILNPVATPEEATVYTLTVTTREGCVSQDVVEVRPYEVPTVDAGPDVSVCRNEPVTLRASGSGGSNYRWFPADGLGSPNEAETTVPTDRPGIYYVMLTSDAGCETIDSVSVSIEPAAALNFVLQATNTKPALPGDRVTVELRALSDELKEAELTEFTLEFSHDPVGLAFLEESFVANPALTAGNWDFDFDVDALNGVVRIDAAGDVPVLSEELGNFKFFVYLTPHVETNSPLVFNESASGVPGECFAPLYTNGEIELSEFCLRGNRYVDAGAVKYALGAATPNPAGNVAVIPYALGISAETTVTIYNTMGEVVDIPLKGRMEAGEHVLEYDVRSLPSGQYFYRLVSGPFVETKSFGISR